MGKKLALVLIVWIICGIFSYAISLEYGQDDFDNLEYLGPLIELKGDE